MKIGYARVSTEDQLLDLQIEGLRQAGCERIFEEKKSGTLTRRPALHAALGALRKGDVLVVWKLDRLGRSLQDLIKILGTLERRGIAFWSISDQIDTQTPAGKLVFHITGAVAEFERALISERTKAGMQAAQRRGRTLGRPRALTANQELTVQRMALCDEIPLELIAARMKVSKTTVWRAVDKIRSMTKAIRNES
ncbi:recombinase family protein [Pseudomonas plecoglossicida]|uniref:Recombinase family protein n=1 Tax=Pseudomonas plecoglossicida TaxID=70775 RepID=A0AAD0R0S9_PSEDL|nr:recombinase family protein [Pseudomonas plecoglossicida]AXM98042.1 recombinase family protein [Pseudomonas plecoglossicida]EPB96029.1 invertase/recombinase like protein [Pseudomonas plecoglossicida NB2011]QLB54186.1 recombinase family protein [Pseudomonas plecoglossicida]GLR38554.1 resolvase [Pseudomonas plecoglossicida]